MRKSTVSADSTEALAIDFRHSFPEIFNESIGLRFPSVISRTLIPTSAAASKILPAAASATQTGFARKRDAMQAKASAAVE